MSAGKGFTCVYGNGHKYTGFASNSLMNKHTVRGEYDEALEYGTKAVALDEEVNGENDLNAATSFQNFGHVYLKKNEYNTALEYFMKSLNICEDISCIILHKHSII